VQITGSGTDISVVAASPLTVNEDVVAPGAITLEASGNPASAGDDLTLNANVTSTGGGTVTLRAGDDIVQTGGAVESNGGPINATANTEGDASDGDTAGFVQSFGTSFVSSGSNIDVSAYGDVSVALLDAGAGHVEVDATAGAINDATDDTATDFTGAVVTLTAHERYSGSAGDGGGNPGGGIDSYRGHRHCRERCGRAARRQSGFGQRLPGSHERRDDPDRRDDRSR